jgi:hypothetical protein
MLPSGFEPEKLTIYSGTLLVQIGGTLLVISDNASFLAYYGGGCNPMPCVHPTFSAVLFF